MELIIKLSINFLCGILVMMIHELPKALVAHFLTHPLHKKRWVSPLKYIDRIGLALFTVSFAGIGWQKPYTYNPNRLINKQKSLLPIMLAGQLASLSTTLLILPLWREMIYAGVNSYGVFIANKLMFFSFIIFIINLFPLPPFDMSQILYAYSPSTYAKLFQNQRYLLAAFFLLVILGVIELLGVNILNTWLNLFI